MKTAHYLIAFLACTAATVGGIAILQAQQEAAPASATAPAAAAGAATQADGFTSTEERFFYAMGFEQANRAKQQGGPDKKTDSDAFVKGFKDGLAGQDSSYAEGLLMGSQVMSMKTMAQKDGVNFNIDSFSAGLTAAMKGEKGRLTEEQRKAAFQAFQADMQKKQQEKAGAEAAKQKADSAAYLAANIKKEGWVATKSGLQYKIVKAGEGAHPLATDTVSVNYEGHLVDGKEFDSSYKRGQPAEFPLNGVIPAWTEAVQLIGKGGKLEIAAPSDIAYGDQGRPGIPGGAALVFTIELLDIKKADAAK